MTQIFITALKKYGWRVDLGKLKALFEARSNLKLINYHVGIPAESDESFKGTEKYLQKLQEIVTVKTKPLKYIRTSGKIVKKADVDVEIVLDVVRSIDRLDVVIVMSGDSDYLELKNYLSDGDIRDTSASTILDEPLQFGLPLAPAGNSPN